MSGVSEKEIENAMLRYLNMMPDCWAYKINNVGIYDPKKKTYRAVKNKFVLKGTPDILGIYKGKPLAIEVKGPRGKVSKEQQDFLNKHKSMGGIGGVARNLNELREILNEHTNTEGIPE